MGTWRSVSCVCCGHQRHRISAGPDCAMAFSTLTMRCGKCRDLVDVTYHLRNQCVRVPSSQPRGEKQVDYPEGLIRAYPELACPYCGGQDLSFWDWRHGCPKCGGNMELMEEGGCHILFD